MTGDIVSLCENSSQVFTAVLALSIKVNLNPHLLLSTPIRAFMNSIKNHRKRASISTSLTPDEKFADAEEMKEEYD